MGVLLILELDECGEGECKVCYILVRGAELMLRTPPQAEDKGQIELWNAAVEKMRALQVEHAVKRGHIVSLGELDTIPPTNAEQEKGN